MTARPRGPVVKAKSLLLFHETGLSVQIAVESLNMGIAFQMNEEEFSGIKIHHHLALGFEAQKRYSKKSFQTCRRQSGRGSGPRQLRE